MPFNPNSLKNLNRSGGKQFRKTLTKQVVENATQYLSDNYEYFSDQMHSLPAKEYCDAYLKLISLVIPKNISLDTHNYEKPVFTIIPASTIDIDNLTDE